MSNELPAPGTAVRAAAGMTAPKWLICLACLLLPWLNPFASGPSSSVGPWLFSAFCLALAYGIQHPARQNAAALLGLAGICVWTVLRGGVTLDTVAFAAACLLMFLAAGVAASAAPCPKLMAAIALAWVAAAAASTAIALLQYFGAAEGFAPWVNVAATGEAFANLRQRNQFASLTSIGMASLLWLSSRSHGRWPATATAAAAMAWLAVGNAATTSRTGLLQILLLGLLACAWPAPRRRRVLVWLAGASAYVLAALALPWLLEMATGVAGNRLWHRVAAVDACSSRLALWSNVLDLIGRKPWLGWGWGNLDYAHYVTFYEGTRFCDILDNAHNLPLHLAVELGIPAALLVCGATMWLIGRARPWAEADPLRQMAWAVLAVIAVHSLLEYPLWYGPFQVAFGLCLGLLGPAVFSPIPPAAADRARSHAAALVMAAGAAAVCAYAAWDYHRVSQIYLAPEERVAGYRDDPLPSIRQSRLFRAQADFAELTITPLTRANAQWTFDTAAALLHYSPEPRVIEKLVESAIVLGRDEEALLHLARFRSAFPQAYAQWSQTRKDPAQAAPPLKSRPPP